ncbi:myb/SANT-like DNA-binding domain-containing protein 3 [Prorops nasuta]|uniref:myb/SANT-like DNA-binding domain-containing protein 3 n=1 Tax=Prorops nasuta TaxID=863751 RepID=UPI0034CEF24D
MINPYSVRNANYTADEKIAFTEIIKKYSNIIENKTTDKFGLSDKGKAWNEVEKEFSLITCKIETQEKLKKLWKNLKATARKKFADLKRNTYMTGGGAYNGKPDVLMEKVHEIIGLSIDGLINPFDSDFYYGQSTPNNVFSENEENNDPDDPDPVFEHLVENEEVRRWDHWNAEMLQTPLSEPLAKNIAANKSTEKTNAPNVCSQKKHQNHDQDVYTVLMKSKLELVNLMKKHFIEKEKLDKKILETQLRKEILQVEILEKQLRKSN